MILWDWDLKHWYKPQYQVSAVFILKVHLHGSVREHTANTGLFRWSGLRSPPLEAAYKSPFGHSVLFLIFGQAKYTLCKNLTYSDLGIVVMPHFYLSQTFFVLFELCV